MSSPSSPDQPEQPPVSPYGPVDGTEPDAQASPPAPATGAGDSEGVVRARARIRRLAIVLPIVGLALCVIGVAVQVTTGGGFVGADPIGELLWLVFVFAGPTLLVLGLHMVIWRALVRPLARMTSGARLATIIGVGALLAFVSVIAVILVIFGGFVVVSGLLGVS